MLRNNKENSVKKIILSLFLVAAVFFGCIGCSSGATGAEITQSSIAEFESLAELQTINVFSDSGCKVSLNTQEEYLSAGEASMYVEFYGSDGMPMPNFFLDNQIILYAKRDEFIKRSNNYSNVKSFSVDIYNVSDRNTNVYFEIVTESGNKIVSDYFPLIKEQMNHCVFDIDLTRAVYLGIDKVDMFVLHFDSVLSIQTPLKLYIDHFVSRDYVNKPDTSLTLPELEENEICYFEDEYVFDTLVVADTDLPITGHPFMIEKNEDPQFVTQGKSSLKITRFPTISQTSNNRRWLDINFDARYISEIDFYGYDINKYEICFDVYSDYSETIDFVCKFITSSGYINSVTYLQPEQWTSVRLKMNEITNNGIVMDWNSLSAIQFMLHEHFGPTKAIIYVDNMRIEPIQEG